MFYCKIQYLNHTCIIIKYFLKSPLRQKEHFKNIIDLYYVYKKNDLISKKNTANNFKNAENRPFSIASSKSLQIRNSGLFKAPLA